MKKKKSASKTNKLLFGTIIFVVLVIILAFLRPSGKVLLKSKVAGPKKDDILKKFGKALDVKKAPVQQKQPPRKISVNSGDYQVQQSYKEHGQNAVVRAKKDIILVKPKQPMPLNKPNYDKPLDLTYYSLKKIYTYYRLKNKFPQPVVNALNGSAATLTGIVMPVDPVPKNGIMLRFWLANPVVVMAGCVFCNPPTMADLIYVEIPFGVKPLKVSREKMFTDIVMIKLKGRFIFGPKKKDGVQYLFKMDYNSSTEMN